MFVTPSWFNLSTSSAIARINCIPNFEQEPYYVLKHTRFTPLYDERFVDYGYNKIQHMRHLTYIGYRFFILSNAYAVDMPHPQSDFRRLHISSHEKMKQLYIGFLYDKKWKTKIRQKMRYCSNFTNDSLYLPFCSVSSKQV